MPDCVFVYGSLRRRGARIHPLLAPARFLGSAQVGGRRVRAGRYPAARPDRGSVVDGELYRLLAPRRTLRRLDLYEDCRPGQPRCGRYARQRVRVRTAAGAERESWIYWYRGG